MTIVELNDVLVLQQAMWMVIVMAYRAFWRVMTGAWGGSWL